MINIQFEAEHTKAERKAELLEHLKRRVTAVDARGVEYSGTLDAVGTVADISGNRVELHRLASVKVYAGGDWATTTGHSAASKTARVWMRCTDAQKAAMESEYQKDGAKTLSEWLLGLAERRITQRASGRKRRP